MMNICIVQKFGKIHMEGEFLNNNGVLTYRKTNNPVRIEKCIKSLSEAINMIRISKKDLLFVSGKCKILVEDYQTVLKHDILRPLKRFLPKSYLNTLEKNNKFKKFAINIASISLIGACVLSGSIISNSKEEPIIPTNTYTKSSEYNIKNNNTYLNSEANQPTFTFDNFASRIAEVDGLPLYDDGYNLGSKLDTLYVSNFLSSPRGYILIKTAKDYGVDPYLLLAKAITESNLHHEETLPGGKFYNYGYGIMQIDNPADGKIIEAFNYNTNEISVLELNKENVSDYEKNVQAGAMIMQRYLEKYNQNIFLTIQAYNYGDGMMNSILKKYAVDTNQTIDDIINNPNDLGWIALVNDAHNNPKNYISNWEGKTYGNPNYLKKVLDNFAGTKTTNLDFNGTSHEIDILSTLETINTKNHSR